MSGGQSQARVVLAAKSVSKEFSGVPALTRVSISAGPGINVVLGENGAGKSTLLAVLAAMLRVSHGQVTVKGGGEEESAGLGRGRIGFLGHRTFLYPQLTVEENLTLYGRLYGLPDVAGRTAEVLGQLALLNRRGAKVAELSRGLAQRAGLARALLHDPPVLLLDEPFSGLDRAGRDRLERLLESFCEESRTVVLTTHDLAIASRVADRVVLLHRGRVRGETLWPDDHLTIEDWMDGMVRPAGGGTTA